MSVDTPHIANKTGLWTVCECGFLLSSCVFRSGVWLQSVQSVSQGERHSAELC